MMMPPKKMKADELATVLTTMAAHVKEDDSYDGFIEYHATKEPGTWEVQGSFRVGNAEGQGGVILLSLPERDEPNNKATEMEWLSWFYANADFGPADEDVFNGMKRSFKAETGKSLPDGYSDDG